MTDWRVTALSDARHPRGTSLVALEAEVRCPTAPAEACSPQSIARTRGFERRPIRSIPF
jgi:hypothetical protein